MSHHTCPKCRQAVSDESLDVGDCPFCGYDGPMAPATSGKTAWLLVTLAMIVGGLTLGGILLFPRSIRLQPAPTPEFTTGQKPTSSELAALSPLAIPIEPALAPLPRVVEPIGKKEVPEPGPVAFDPPKFNPWNPIPANAARPVVLNPREAPDRRITMKVDNPHGTITIPDLLGKEQVVLSGRVKILRIGSITGDAVIDASELAAEEIIVSGDMNGNAVAKLNAPGGKVAIGGHVVGSARLTVSAPGGETTLLARSGRLGGAATATVTARRVVLDGPVNESARIAITLSPGGFLKIALMDGAASVAYKKSAAADPEPTIETGELRNGSKLLRE